MGGAERAALNLAKLWSDLGDEVVVMPTYSGGGSGSFYPASPKVRVCYLANHSESARAFPRLLALKNFIIDEKFDVAVSFITNVNVAAIIAGLLAKVPIIVCERSDPFVIPISRFWRILRALTYPFSQHVIIQTSELLEKFKRSNVTYKNKLTVIPNSIPSVFLKDPLIISSSRRILAVGRLSKEKQFDHLIIAFSEILCSENWIVEIFGEGEERENLQRLIESLGLSRQIFLRGATLNIENIYKTGDIFCLTSKYEGFPNALLEAMVSGCAVVCYASPCGPSEMLDNGENGILINLNDIRALSDGIEKLMLDDSLRQELGERSSRFVRENYNAEVVLRKWHAVLSLDD
ncbi:glycosyltransferase family 4 protein [Gammaproteobacteria bacterium]|nr:glycosyltransferase family 4 protein [Gammaproteobacteria bacterium]